MERLIAVVAPFVSERLAQQESFESRLAVLKEQTRGLEEFVGPGGSVVFEEFEESAA